MVEKETQIRPEGKKGIPEIPERPTSLETIRRERRRKPEKPVATPVGAEIQQRWAKLIPPEPTAEAPAQIKPVQAEEVGEEEITGLEDILKGTDLTGQQGAASLEEEIASMRG